MRLWKSRSGARNKIRTVSVRGTRRLMSVRGMRRLMLERKPRLRKRGPAKAQAAAVSRTRLSYHGRKRSRASMA